MSSHAAQLKNLQDANEQLQEAQAQYTAVLGALAAVLDRDTLDNYVNGLLEPDEEQMAREALQQAGVSDATLTEIRAASDTWADSVAAFARTALETAGDNPAALEKLLEQLDTHEQEKDRRLPANIAINHLLKALNNTGPNWREKGMWQWNEAQLAVTSEHHPPGGGFLQVAVHPLETTAYGDGAETLITRIKTELLTDLAGIDELDRRVCGQLLAAVAESGQAHLTGPVEVTLGSVRQSLGANNLRGQRRRDFDNRVRAAVDKIRRISVTATAIKGKEPGGKVSTISWHGDRLLDITIGEEDGEITRWRVRPGQWAYYFLNKDAFRWTAGITAQTFRLSYRDDRRVERLAYNIITAVHGMGWREGKGQRNTWKYQQLLEAAGESPEHDVKPSRLAETLEAALELIAATPEQYGFSRITYTRISAVTAAQTRNWVKRYFDQGRAEFMSLEQATISASVKPRQQPKRSRPAAPLSSNFGAQVRQAREERHLNQEVLARIIGISRPYLSSIENGRRAPSRKVSEKLTAWLSSEA